MTVKPIDGILSYSLTSGYTVNIGDFNNKRAEGMVSGNFSADIPIEDVTEYLSDKLYELIATEIQTAKDLAPPKSYIHFIG